MTPSKRIRFNAFDDFPGSGQSADTPQNTPSPAPQGQAAGIKAPPVERIERLKPSQMMPDRFQPRRLLPSSIRMDFFAGNLTCYQAAAEWLALARQDPGHRAQVERLLAMGGSFEEHGQIKSITGSWVPALDGSFIFQIETGERRFWAACLRASADHAPQEPLLRVETIEKPTRQRQVLENRHAETPSAVSQSCEISALILSGLGIEPEAGSVDEYDYFRQARSQRMPAGLWEKITPIMQLSRPRMVQLLNILQMPTPLLELADRYRLPERVLREVLNLPPAQWEKALLLSIQNSLTSDEVAEMGEEDPHKKAVSPAPPAKIVLQGPVRLATSGLRRFSNTLYRLDEINRAQSLDEIADDLVISGQAEDLMNLLDELKRLVRARLRRR